MAEVNPRDDVYIEAARAFDERFAHHKIQAKRWFAFALVSMVAAMGSLFFAMWIGVKAQYIPYIVAVDDLGRVGVAPRIEQNSDIPNAVMRREMSDFVMDWRAIPNDEDVLVANLSRVLSYIEPQSAANRLITALGTNPETAPFGLFQEGVGIAVEVVSVIQTSDQTWNVEWIERRADRNSGRPISTQRFEGAFVTARVAQISEELLSQNPLGLAIRNIDIQRLERGRDE